MDRLLTIHINDFEPTAPTEVDRSGFTHRVAARAVVLDENDAVGLLHVSREGYYKLAGGGVDEGEDIPTALERELLEELGCRAEVIAQLGEIREYRDYWQMIQTSHCYIARVIGEKGRPAFTELETSQGFEVAWQPDIDTAIRMIKIQQPHGGNEALNHLFMQKRDLAVLHAARKVLSKNA